MSVATANIKNYRLRRLALIVVIPLIPFIMLWLAAVAAWDVLAEAWRCDLKYMPDEVRKQWKKDYR